MHMGVISHNFQKRENCSPINLSSSSSQFSVFNYTWSGEGIIRCAEGSDVQQKKQQKTLMSLCVYVYRYERQWRTEKKTDEMQVLDDHVK